MSSSFFRVTAIACALVLGAGVVAAITTDGDGAVTASETGDRGGAEVETDDATSSTTAPPSTDGGDSASSSTAVDESTTTSAGSVSTSETTSTTAHEATTTTAAPDAPLGTTPTTPGTYDYDVSGTVDGERVSGTSTLEVSQPDAEGRQSQVQRGPEGTMTTVYRFSSEGTYLESLQMEAAQGSFTMNAVAPLLIIPAGSGAGAVSTGRLRGSGITANVTFTLVAVAESTSTVNIEADITGKVSGFDVEGTMDSTIVARTADQLPLELDSKTDLRAAGGLYSTRSNTHSEFRR